jgi:threonine dehydratase
MDVSNFFHFFLMIPLTEIQSAQNRIRELFSATPLEYNKRLSDHYKAEIYLKREDLTPVRSYKIRGAYNCMSQLTSTEKSHGIVAASAGNHAQWVAYSAAKLQIHGKIFMPRLTPEQKVYKTKQFWGEFIEVILIGDTFDDAFREAKKYEQSSGAVFIHPFDDDRIIAGQGTVGLEIRDVFWDTQPDIILCPVGGGGLISGMISVFSSGNSRIFGIEPTGAPSMIRSLEAKENITLDTIETFVDGASVKRVGDRAFRIASDYDLDMISVHENAVCTTMLEYLREEWIVTEPAGALATAALQKIRHDIVGKRVVVILSGSNFDFERINEVKERSLKHEGKKRYLLIKFPQRPGALKEFIWLLWPDDDIVRFEYLKKSNKERAPALIGIETNDPSNFTHLFAQMETLGISFQDITNNPIFYDLLV